MNREDVLDESYRKAGKLDLSNFLSSLNPFSYGIVERIKKNILSAEDQQDDLRAELYKLNVYGMILLFMSGLNFQQSMCSRGRVLF